MNAMAKPIENAEHALSLARDQRERVELRLHQLEHDIAALDSEMVDIKASLEEAIDHPKRLQALRNRRIEIRSQLADLAEERQMVQVRLDKASRCEQDATVQLHIATRQCIQIEGVAVASTICQLIHDLRPRFGQWMMLRERDRQSKDIIRSLDVGPLENVPTYDWATSIDQTTAEAIAEVLAEGERLQKALSARTEATLLMR